MKALRIVAISILTMLVTSACDRSDSDPIEMDYFYGAWQEYFGPDYFVEGSRIWYIRDEFISVITYDWYSDTQWERMIPYSLQQKKGKRIVTLHYQEEQETNDQSYYIIQLTDKEMIWRNVDFKDDTLHFVNGKFWASLNSSTLR